MTNTHRFTYVESKIWCIFLYFLHPLFMKPTQRINKPQVEYNHMNNSVLVLLPTQKHTHVFTLLQFHNQNIPNRD